jgi:hypothetical protein
MPSPLIIQPCGEDTYLRYNVPDNADATDIYVEVLIRTSPALLYRPIYRFDFSALPIGATITVAELSLYYYDILVADAVGRKIGRAHV